MPNTTINRSIGSPFIELPAVDSTNNYAMRQVQQGFAAHGAVYFAYSQTAGKGQREKQWISKPGENIMFSAVLNTNGLLVSAQFHLSMVTALAAYDLFCKYAGDQTKIKWPNDIYWRDRKAAGILIENIIRGQEWQWAVAGIGININQTEFDASLLHAVSLKQITGKTFERVVLAKELCQKIETRFVQLKAEGIQTIVKNYNEVLYKKDEVVRLKKDNALFNCIVKEVSESGQLLVSGASKQYFDFGEVEWMVT